MWTQYWDMHSGGSTKVEPYEKIYAEVDEAHALIFFYNRFGFNPERVSCTCCGSDYSISHEESLDQLTGYHRGCDYDNEKHEYVELSAGKSYEPYRTLEEYSKEENVLVIPASDIRPEELEGEDPPASGYVWVG